MHSDRNHLNIKYLKLVNHTASRRTDWSYKEHYKIGDLFYLHWAINEDQKKGMSEEEINKILVRKEKDAKKAIQDDRILLCQNHCEHGHRVTHVVETATSAAEQKDGMWSRLVKVVWVVKQDEWNNPPETKHVIGSEFKFRSGNLISIDAPSITLNLEDIVL